MPRGLRRWYKVGHSRSVLVLIDFENEAVLGSVEPTIKEKEYPCWTPNQDDALYELLAYARQDSKTFPYNPHNLKETESVLTNAMLWVEDTLGPPVVYTPRWVFFLRSLMFWKYKLVWREFRIVGLIPRGTTLGLDDFNKIK